MTRDGNVWLSQQQIATLFGTSVPKVNMHISNILKERELSANSVIKNYLTTASDGKPYDVMGVSGDMRKEMNCQDKAFGDVPQEEWYYVMLDEVQLVPEFEDVLSSYLSIKNVDIYVTGSNSRFLSKDVITEFRGRGHEIHITPLSMSEFVDAHPEMTFEEALDKYMTYGGLPMVCLQPDVKEKEAYLKGLFEKTYLTDIKDSLPHKRQ